MKPLLLLLALSLTVAGCDNSASLHSVSPSTHAAAQPAAASVSEATSISSAQKSEPTTMSQNPSPKITKSEDEWKKLLTPEQFFVLREKGTERPFTNKYDEHFEKGAYTCAACGTELFSSDTKFNSGCGWPAFYAAKAGDKVKLTKDTSHGMTRTEVTCAACDGHLGHIFDDAPQTPTGQRYCINSVSLKFIPAAAPPKKIEN